ncbi:hypothetical protein BKA70DRAFT_1315040 [Coprinopsis sp. MPI-PUGE-AT-0042]|nr:hypothetical protein BKA70DRAFT_1315040 [Coprinopsis sp. MPI-PUGE-AT-0042]
MEAMVQHFCSERNELRSQLQASETALFQFKAEAEVATRLAKVWEEENQRLRDDAKAHREEIKSLRERVRDLEQNLTQEGSWRKLRESGEALREPVMISKTPTGPTPSSKRPIDDGPSETPDCKRLRRTAQCSIGLPREGADKSPLLLPNSDASVTFSTPLVEHVEASSTSNAFTRHRALPINVTQDSIHAENFLPQEGSGSGAHQSCIPPSEAPVCLLNLRSDNEPSANQALEDVRPASPCKGVTRLPVGASGPVLYSSSLQGPGTLGEEIEEGKLHLAFEESGALPGIQEGEVSLTSVPTKAPLEAHTEGEVEASGKLTDNSDIGPRLITAAPFATLTKCYLRMPTLSIVPSPEHTPAAHDFASAIYANDEHQQQRFAWPMLIRSPDMPRLPGQPGLIFSATHVPIWDGPRSLVYRSRGAKGRKEPGNYLGEYEAVAYGQMTVDCWRVQGGVTKGDWAKSFTSKGSDVGMEICARVALRKRGVFPSGDPEKDKEDIEKEVQAIRAGTVALVNYKHISCAFDYGEENPPLNIVLVKCVGYDHGLAEELRSKWPAYAATIEAQKATKAPEDPPALANEKRSQ